MFRVYTLILVSMNLGLSLFPQPISVHVLISDVQMNTRSKAASARRIAALPYSQIESLPLEVLQRVFFHLDFGSMIAVNKVSSTQIIFLSIRRN